MPQLNPNRSRDQEPAVHRQEAPGWAHGKEASVPGQRVLTIGHSFHVFISQILADVARSEGIVGHTVLGTYFLGGSRVIDHWRRPDSYDGAGRILRRGNVDVLTLSPILHPDEGIDRFARLALEHNPGVRITVQASWAPFDGVMGASLHCGKPDRDRMSEHDLWQLHAPYFESLDEEITSLNRKVGRQALFVVPVGQALLRLRERIRAGKAPGLDSQEDLFVDALGHPAAALQVLNAYVHFCVIYRRSPSGLPISAALAHVGSSTQRGAMNRLLQDLAWQAVTEHRLSGVSAGM